MARIRTKNNGPEPKNLKNAEMLQTLAEMWMNPVIRNWFENERSREVWKLKFIRTGSIEGDALELARQNGSVAYVENLLSAMKNAYKDYDKIQTRFRKEVPHATDEKGKESDEQSEETVRQES